MVVPGMLLGRESDMELVQIAKYGTVTAWTRRKTPLTELLGCRHPVMIAGIKGRALNQRTLEARGRLKVQSASLHSAMHSRFGSIWTDRR